MKIIEIIPQLAQGGAERFVIDLCNEMAKNHEVILVVFHDISNCDFLYQDLNNKIRVVCMHKKMGMDWILFFRLVKFIYTEKPDVIHTHLQAIIYMLFAYFLFPHIKFIHTVHNDAIKEAGGGISKWCRKFVFKFHLTSPVTISRESQHSFFKFYHLHSTLIYNGRLIYHGFDDLSLVRQEMMDVKNNKNAKLVVNIARMQPQKNQFVLAKAVHNLNRKGFAIELCIIGDKANEQIVSDIENLNSPYIHLLGRRTNPRDYMCVADAFCLFSLYEGMPITLIECFSVGALPLCSPVGGIVDVIKDGENGLLANSSNQKDIEETLVRFCNLSTSEIDRIKSNSRCSFSMFDMGICTSKYIELFKKK